jgi:hypothetical protein
LSYLYEGENMNASAIEVIIVVICCSLVGYFCQKLIAKFGKAEKSKAATQVESGVDKMNKLATNLYWYTFRAFVFLIGGFLAWLFYLWVRGLF